MNGTSGRLVTDSAKSTPMIGRYELVSRLAVGGMAELFLARERGIAGLERLVVIKRILPHLAHQQSFIDMFLREARIVARLQNPNVVQIFELNESDGAYYIAMEYIHGTTVRELQILAQERNVGFPLEVVVALVEQSARGLHAAHELTDLDGRPLGLVHRDVSPHNLMCTEDGNVKLLDFGVAKATEGVDSTYSGNLKGKFAYMSPEQCLRSQLDRRSDVFALGIVMWELLTGQRLFKRPNELATMQAIINGDIPRPSDLGARLPLEVEDVLMRALAVDRDRRFVSAEEMRQALVAAARTNRLNIGTDRVADFVREIAGMQLEQRRRTMKSALERALTSNERVALLHRTGSFAMDEEDEGQTSVDREIENLRAMTSVEGTRTTPSGSMPGRQVPFLEPAYAPTPQPAPPAPAQPLAEAPRSHLIPALSAGVVIAAIVLAVVWWQKQPTQPEPTVLLGEPSPVGWAPTVTVQQLESELGPLRTYLEREYGRPLPMRVTKSYQDLADQLLRGDVDYAMLPPYLYVQTVERNPKVSPLAFKAFDGAKTSDGMLLVRMDSGYESVNDLEGKTFCLTDKNSTTGYLLPRLHLRKKGFDPDKFIGKIHWSGDHLQVMRDLVTRKCDAAATYSGAFLSGSLVDVPTGQIRTLASTGTVPQDAIVAGPNVSDADKKRMKAALLAFDPKKELGVKLLGETQRIEAFLEASDDDYRTLREAMKAEGAVP